LGHEIALFVLSAIGCFWVSYRALNETRDPSPICTELGYFTTAWMFGAAGLICVLLALAA